MILSYVLKHQGWHLVGCWKCKEVFATQKMAEVLHCPYCGGKDEPSCWLAERIQMAAEAIEEEKATRD